MAAKGPMQIVSARSTYLPHRLLAYHEPAVRATSATAVIAVALRPCAWPAGCPQLSSPSAWRDRRRGAWWQSGAADRGLTRIELTFAVALAAAGAGLIVALGLEERRRILAIAAARGAKPRQLGALVWSEAIVMLVGGGVAGAMLGWGVAEMLVKLLTGVFDPPPEHLSVPWLCLAVLAVATAGTVRRRVCS
jgi:predicted lysophospholipase L1 biosynthesis ABC-type transport system permease subunit